MAAVDGTEVTFFMRVEIPIRETEAERGSCFLSEETADEKRLRVGVFDRSIELC